MPVEPTSRHTDSATADSALSHPAAFLDGRSRMPHPSDGEHGLEAHRPSVYLSEDTYGSPYDRFFLAEKQPDGTYGVTFTEQGMKTFETALGIAHDLGGDSRISPYSTLADLMERTATREEFSQVLRGPMQGVSRRFRLVLLRRKLRGSERPSRQQIALGHIGKLVIVLLFVFWTVQQFVAAVGDITAIPNILSSAPTDLLHPLASFGQIGSNISDAGHSFLLGIVGLHLTYLVAVLVRPFARIYRKDAIIPGERMVLRLINNLLARVARRGKAVPSRSTARHS